MSISTEISRIKAAKESLKRAINAKGGTLSDELIDDYAAAVTALPTGGSDIDLSGVTVTADKLLAGVVAVDGSGSKVTGTIPEVTASKSGNTVTVPAGHHAKKQEFIFEEAPINLSFVTATASDILTGKVGADKNGNPVTGTLVIPSVPEAPDLSVVTVTADTMLKGKVAVSSAGQKITGTIETVTATLNANTVSVPKGYIASAQTLTVPEIPAPTVSGNYVSIDTGYVKNPVIISIKKATATLSANVVTIPEGYHDANTLTVAEAEALTVSGNKVTVPVGYIKAERTAEIPVVSATLTDNKVTIPAGYNNGQTLTVAEATAPSVSGNVVTFGKGYNATEKKVTVGTARESTTITPSTSWKQISADTYCVGTQYIAGDENLVPENIADGVSIFNVQGTHKGGGGAEFYKCASVNTSAKTWTGYKAVLTDGVYSFEETVTEGLSYSENFPLPAQAYTSDLSVTVKELQSKDIVDISGGEVIGQRYVVTDAKTLATGYFEYRKLNSGWSLMWHVITHGSDRDYYHIIAVGLIADAVRMDASGYRYDPVEFTVDGDSRNWYYCRSQGVGANDGFNPIFNGEPIDVGSNGEDYLAQAKELLNNYLAGTIIGESPDSGDKTYELTVSGLSGSHEDANGDYWKIDPPSNMWSGYNTTDYGVWTNGTYYIAYCPQYWTGWTLVNNIELDPSSGTDIRADYAMAGAATPGATPNISGWGSATVTLYSGNKEYKYTVSGFTDGKSAANGDYWQIEPTAIHSVYRTDLGVYTNGTYYLVYCNNYWTGWCMVTDITIDPAPMEGSDALIAPGPGGDSPAVTWGMFGATVAEYAG